jgi:hypothetical protein
MPEKEVSPPVALGGLDMNIASFLSLLLSSTARRLHLMAITTSVWEIVRASETRLTHHRKQAVRYVWEQIFRARVYE